MSQIMRELKRIMSEVAWLESNAETDPIQSNLRLGLIAFKNIRNDELATKYLLKVVESEPNNDIAHYALAKICIVNEDWTHAKEHERAQFEWRHEPHRGRKQAAFGLAGFAGLHRAPAPPGKRPERRGNHVQRNHMQCRKEKDCQAPSDKGGQKLQSPHHVFRALGPVNRAHHPIPDGRDRTADTARNQGPDPELVREGLFVRKSSEDHGEQKKRAPDLGFIQFFQDNFILF